MTRTHRLRSIERGFLFLLVVPAIVSFLPLIATAGAILTPTSNNGDTYQLAFVTSTTRNATSGNINDYHDFVQLAANAAGIGSSIGVQWKALASTLGNNAKFNALVTAPVFNMGGDQVATGYADLWDGSLNGGLIWYDEHGTLRYGVGVWTGSDSAGNGAYGWLYSQLGQASAIYGITNNGSSYWIEYNWGSSSGAKSLYALSEPLVRVGANSAVPSRWYSNHSTQQSNASGQLGGGSSTVGGVDYTVGQIGAGGGSVWGESSLAPVNQLSTALGAAAASSIDFTLPSGNVRFWNIQTMGDVSGGAQLTFAYDDATLGGISEADMQIFHYVTGTGWERLTILAHNLSANTITVQTSSFSPFIVGVPEPASWLLAVPLAAGMGLLIWRRQKA